MTPALLRDLAEVARLDARDFARHGDADGAAYLAGHAKRLEDEADRSDADAFAREVQRLCDIAADCGPDPYQVADAECPYERLDGERVDFEEWADR